MKKYTIEMTDDGGFVTISAENDGFTALELIGLFEHRKEDIIRQMRGEIRPDVITRKVVKEEVPENE